jgi:subtilisin family serine protease
MKSKFARAITLFIILTLIAIPVSARFGSQSLDGQPPKIDISKLSRVENNLSVEEVAPANPKTGVVNAEGKSIYMVRLQDPPLAAYKGGIEGLAATNPSVLGQQKLNVDSLASQAYLAYLADRHKAMVGSMDKLLNRPVEVVYNYVSANNGMAIYLTPSEAAQIQQLPGVIYVEPDSEQELHTDAGPEWIGAPSIWDGSETGGLPGTMGEGTIVGVIDTGINPSNPSFAEVGGDGYVFSNPKGHFVGVCDPSNPSYDPTFPCNNKLIGAWGYSTVNGGDPRDYDGHGSHTASTAAGNFVDAEVVGPTLTITRSISGVAPHANLIAYAACCTNSALSAAIDQIILDSVDVVNYSIGSVGCTATPDPWADFDSAGYLNAREAGIFVATSAGNCGPGDFTVGSPADVPWVTSVGATTHNRELVNALIDMAGGNIPPPGDIYGKSFTSGYGPAEIVYAGDFGDALCLNPFPADTFDGQIVVCDRGTNGRVEKGSNVKAGGAGGYILANDAASGESLNGDAHELPAVHITYEDGVRLKDWLADGGASHTGTIMGTQVQEDPAFGDILASFSSRGGNKALADILVPSVTAPGVDILAALGTGDSIEWGFESGTSMASPHTAGAGALLMSLHPGWTPAEVQSALMTTAYEDILNDDGVTPATTF